MATWVATVLPEVVRRDRRAEVLLGLMELEYQDSAPEGFFGPCSCIAGTRVPSRQT